MDAGLEQDDIKNLTKRKKFETDHHEIDVQDLMEIISKYIICHEGKVEYGYKTPVKTKSISVQSKRPMTRSIWNGCAYY